MSETYGKKPFKYMAAAEGAWLLMSDMDGTKSSKKGVPGKIVIVHGGASRFIDKAAAEYSMKRPTKQQVRQAREYLKQFVNVVFVGQNDKTSQKYFVADSYSTDLSRGKDESGTRKKATRAVRQFADEQQAKAEELQGEVEVRYASPKKKEPKPEPQQLELVEEAPRSSGLERLTHSVDEVLKLSSQKPAPAKKNERSKELEARDREVESILKQVLNDDLSSFKALQRLMALYGVE